MKTFKLALCAAIALMAGPLAPSAALARSTHVTAGGAPCIHSLGVTYDPSTKWYSARFSNDCDAIRIDFTRYDPDSGRTVDDYFTARGYGETTVIIYHSTSISWTEGD